MSEISPALYRAGQGEPLLLLHGFTASWPIWKPVLADLVPRFEVIAPTLAGHDGGPPFRKPGPFTIAQAVDSAEEHLDELGITRAHIVGNSGGGTLALELAKRGRALSVVAFSPGGGWSEGSPESQRVARFFVRQMRMARASQARLPYLARRPGTRRMALRDVMRHGELVQPAAAIDMVRSSLRCTLFDGVIGALRAGRATMQDLDTIRVPTLIAWGQLDRVFPIALNSQRFRTEIPGAEFRVLPDAGHVPMWDAQRLVIETIVSFVTRHAAGLAVA